MGELSLSSRALYERVADLLRQRIFNGELAPAARIDELKLAEEYGISRTPLREALKVLGSEGLVTMQVRRGAYVADVSEHDLADIHHLLALLVSDSVGVAAGRATESQIRELRRLCNELGKSVDKRDRFLEVSEAFYSHLMGIANNRWSDQKIADLRKMSKLNRDNSQIDKRSIDELLAEHCAIMAAFARHDVKEATRLTQAHFSKSFRPLSGAKAQSEATRLKAIP